MEIENLMQLIEAVSRSEITEFQYEDEGFSLHLAKEQKVVVATTEQAPGVGVLPYPSMQTVPQSALGNADIAAEESRQGRTVDSPLVGTFYVAPAEGAAPFVSVGDPVKQGQTLAIVEAMKLMNEIESEYDGVIAEVFVENGQPVEYGQPLFRIV